jgi:hypothetical protein
MSQESFPDPLRKYGQKLENLKTAHFSFVLGTLVTFACIKSHLVSSYIEIYNDNVIDLLEFVPEFGKEEKKHKKRERGEKGSKVKILEDTKNNAMILQGAKQYRYFSIILSTYIFRHVVTKKEHAIFYISKAAAQRSTAATHMNDFSSRSHTILTLSIERSENKEGIPDLFGKIHFVDLAGSEKADKSSMKYFFFSRVG